MDMMKEKGLFGREQRTRFLLLAALFLSCLFIFRTYIFGEDTLVFNDIGSDTYQLYTMQFASIINHLRDGSFAFWDFTNGFGVNEFNLNLCDPSQMLVFAMGYVLGPGRVLFYLVLVQILKIMAAGYIFYHYLGCFELGRTAKFTAAFAYGLNSYLLVWGQHYQFGMITIYFPLLLLFCEKYIQGKKSGRVFPIAVFLCGIYSVYFSYMALAGTGIYLLIRSYMQEGTFLARTKKFLLGCVHILFGLCMSMAVFLPMAMCILGVSGRVSTDGGGILQSVIAQVRKFPYAKYYQSIFLRFFSSALQNSEGLNDKYFETALNYFEDPILCTGLLSLFFNLQLIFRLYRKKISRRTKTGIYIGIGLIIFSIALPIVGTVMNSFTEYTGRFTFVILPFMLLGMSWGLQDLIEEKRPSYPLLLILPIITIAVCVIGYGQSVYQGGRACAVVLGVLGVLLSLTILLYSKISPQKQRMVLGLLVILAMANAVLEGWANYTDRITLKRNDTPAETYQEIYDAAEEMRASEDEYVAAAGKLAYPQKYFRDLYSSPVNAALEYLKENDAELYRVEKDYIPNATTISMDSLAQGYRGITSYNSVQNSNIIDFVDVVVPESHYPDKNHYLFSNIVQDSSLASFFGIRYLMSYTAGLEETGYELLNQFDGMYLYKNENETDFARFYHKTISEDDFRTLCDSDTRDQLLMNYLAMEEGEEIKSLPEEETEEAQSEIEVTAVRDDAHLTGSIVTDRDGYMMFAIPYEEGWTLTVDGEEVETFRGNLGFIAAEVTEGAHEFQMTFTAPGLHTGMKLSAVFWILYLLLYFPGVVPLYFRKVRMK